MIVAIDGPDGTGKDSVIEYLTMNYGWNYLTSFPSYKLYNNDIERVRTPHLNNIRGLLNNYLHGNSDNISQTKFQLACMVDKFSLAEQLLAFKESENVYLINRYIASGVVYGYLSMEHDYDNIYELISLIYDMNQMLIEPNYDICLTANIDTIMNRIGNRGEKKSIYETKEFLSRVINMYNGIYSTTSPKFYPYGSDWCHVINTDNKSIKEVSIGVYEFVMSKEA